MTLRKLVSGDTTTLLALFVLGWLVSAFYRIEWWRDALGVTAGGKHAVVVGLVGPLAVGVWASLLRRRFLWADPAVLTWQDFSRARDRAVVISARVWLHWLLRFAGLGYVAAFLGVVWSSPTWAWQVMAVLVGAGGAVTLPVAAGIGRPWRLPVVDRARRDRLVAGWRERIVRGVAVTFLDPGMLFPAAAAVGIRVRSVRSLIVAGVLGRARFVPVAVLLAVVAASAVPALPAVPDIVIVAVCAYVALVPFGGGAAWLWRSPGLRRWLDERDRTLRAGNIAALTVLAACWGGLLTGASALVGAAAPVDVWPVLVVVAAAVVRTATRPPVDYATPGTTDTPFGQAPVHLIGQLLRGPDLAALGVLATASLPLPVLVTVVAAMVWWAVLR